jgi:hypothetical protein
MMASPAARHALEYFRNKSQIIYGDIPIAGVPDQTQYCGGRDLRIEHMVMEKEALVDLTISDEQIRSFESEGATSSYDTSGLAALKWITVDTRLVALKSII